MSENAGASGLRCASCNAELPSAFPGATVSCSCGRQSELPPVRHPEKVALQGGPYRTAGPANEPVTSVACPFCGNECPPLVRICPHCDVRLENVRCQRCFSLQAPGTFACVRCGQALELEPLLDATDAPCPRCHHALEGAPGGDTRVHECPRCGGMFVARDALAEILCSAELSGALRDGAPRESRAPEREIRYLPCPLCHATMNRVNFGKVSGVIVDVCKPHGTWFDAGELTRIVAFAAAGGLERTRARELEETRTELSRARSERAQAQAGAALEVRLSAEPRLDAWRDLLSRIFSR